MILTSTADLKQYIAISKNFNFADFSPYINKAVLKFTKKYVGNLHIELENAATGTNATIKNEAREHLRNAVANLSLFMDMPLSQVQMDSSGISVATNDNRRSPEWWQVKDIRRELLQSGHEAMDELLKVLEANPTVFTDYAIKFRTINNELIVNNADIFSKYYNINNSRQTYLALQPTIRLIEDKYINKFICNQLFVQLKTPLTGKLNEFKETIQKAIVSFTVAKIANIGLFLLEDKGLRIDFENFMDGRKENPSYGKSVDQLEKLSEELTNNGFNYLQLAKEIVKENPTSFTMCEDPLMEKKIVSGSIFTYDTKGILGL